MEALGAPRRFWASGINMPILYSVRLKKIMHLRLWRYELLRVFNFLRLSIPMES